MRYGYRHVYHRPHFHHRHHFHRRFYAPAYYGYPYYYGYRHRYCRVIWTYYGPRKICRYRPWYRHHGASIMELPVLVRAETKQAPDRAPVFFNCDERGWFNPNPCLPKA